MPTTLAAQLAALELGHLSIASDPGARSLGRPEPEAIDQTLAAVWSDLFALFTDTILEDQAEELGWGFVNLFHRAAAKASTRIDRATDEIRLFLATNDGSEVHSAELAQQVERAPAPEGEMLALEALRETAAALYLAETGSSWKPAGGSRLSHDALSTSAVVQGREFLKARAEGKRRAAMPEGTLVVFAGGRLSFGSADDAKAYGDAIWRTLDRVRANVADMVLVHGGDGKGADRLAASWAERHKVPQIAFSLDTRLGARAGFRRNEQMLGLKPRYVVVFAGNGVLERLVIQAKERGISVVDRRGPLGTNPKHHARRSGEAVAA